MSTAPFIEDDNDDHIKHDSDENRSAANNRILQEKKHPLYPNLFTPLDLGPELGILPNRVLMGSMHTGLEGHSMPSWMERLLDFADPSDDKASHDHVDHSSLDRMASYFRRRALGGVGLMVTGGISPNTQGWVGPFAAQLTNVREMERHKVVTEAVHSVQVPIYGSRETVRSKILMQILHTGRYGYHPFAVSATTGRSPISPFSARALPTHGVKKTIDEFVYSAALAREAGYDGVEIMGSEGYLISQFLSPRTNSTRTDQYGGPSFEDRSRFPLELVREVRKHLGSDFMVIFRISLWELVEGGMSWEETVRLANELRLAGVTLLNTGIGWHESRVPTIASNVPRGAFTLPTHRLRSEMHREMALQRQNASNASLEDEVPIPPIVSTNRINSPETAEEILFGETSDLISMARPLLADPDFLQKAMNERSKSINTCIACNQACLDHAFVGKTASCLVNPVACHEDEFGEAGIDSRSKVLPENDRLHLGVVGAGPAGIAFACTAAERGHTVTLYEGSHRVGGQFHMAKKVPGKEEFYEAIRYWEDRLEGLSSGTSKGPGSVEVRLNTKISVEDMSELSTMNHNGDEEWAAIDKWIISTGVTPRDPKIPGSNDFPDNVLTYIDILKHNKPVGERVAVIGAGGIGFDVSEFLLYGKEPYQRDEIEEDLGVLEGNDEASSGGNSLNSSNSVGSPATTMSVEDFWKEWGVDPNQERRGGLRKEGPTLPHGPPKRTVYLMQRKRGKVGAGLGRTTGWIHRASLQNSKKVATISGIKSYDRIDSNGNLVYTISGSKSKKDNNPEENEQRVLEVDTIVLCAGQEELNDLETASEDVDVLRDKVYPIGGAYMAGELDAKRAIDMGTRLAYRIHEEEVKPGNHVFQSSVGPEEKLFRFLKRWT
jgi:2,4-dienoyl-CoA reductase (NADPH2)